ncbi:MULTISPECIES: hypothetical protein [Lactobacillus]|uniref:hypothetical protein n=1 Tax=Lactobacillus TaxID=1578 RepID=UPI000CD9CCB6|nr:MULTISPECIES: hypothetical protein [Lactobacillus]RVU73119.1 hypothetical protein EJK20_09520 [Lactobacillus xujianguonis]
MFAISLLYNILPFLLMVGIVVFTKHRMMPIGFLIIVYLVAFGLTYFKLPSKNLLSIIWGNVIYGLVYTIATYLFLNITKKERPRIKRIFKVAFIIIGVLGVVSVGGLLHSFMSVKPTWNSIDKVYSKSNEAPTFKRGETPIALAPKTVINRVRKASSDIPHSQYYSISDQVQAQFLKNKPVYVVPVEYSGFWQMTKAGQIPGYFIIDATRQNATPHFVKQPYKFATSAYFNRDAARQIYRYSTSWLDLGSPQLEIDNSGKPYWVQTLYKSEFLSHRVNYQKLHVAVMNAQSGVVKIYPIKKMPKFIDEGITTAIANKLNTDFGKYKYGFWNFSKTGVMKPTGNGVEDGVTSVFNKNGTISYFTDFTTDKTGSDSALGYSMINARSGKLTFYRANNIMDSDGAKNNANQDYKAQQWKANMPILYNVNSRPTWVMTILDSTNAIRGYYYLDAADQSIYGTGSTPTSALDAFRQALVNSGARIGNTDKASLKKVKGIVDRVAVVSSQNKVMFTLKNSKTIYTVNTSDYDFANLMRPNDKVSFKANIVEKKSIGNVADVKDNNLR